MTLVFKGGGATGSTLDVTFDVGKSEAHDGAEMPVKLGDGNFGAVFAAVGGGRKLAVKVIYAHQMPDKHEDSPEQIKLAILHKRQRVEEELQVRDDIFAKLSEKQNEHPEYAFLVNNFDRHLVLPINYTDQLSKAPEFKPFAKRFAEANIKFSGHAYAMEQFECSLKDLMDYGGRGPVPAGANGYAKLRAASMADRERSAIPVLSQVAAGLRVLHAAGYRHQDIKPANVYYRRNATGGIEFRLGDLGFLNPHASAQGGTVLASSEALAIGTKHYRSVEQIDYADTSEVSVEPQKGKGGALLRSRDPKFLRTNIAEGDLVVFPKSAAKHQYRITSFKEEDDKDAPSGKCIEIMIQPPADAQSWHTLAADDCTQASFIKNPTSRTDLFGLGGLLFDILTAGDSPERFYELLRKFDVKGESIQDSVLTYFDNWKAEQHVNADVAAIFQRVAGSPSSSRISNRVLEFLLRCCASNCDDSYFNWFNFERPFEEGEKTPWERLGEELSDLEESIDATRHGAFDINALTKPTEPVQHTHPGTPEVDPQEPVEARELTDLFKMFARQEEDEPAQIQHRWLRGISFLDSAAAHISRVKGELTSRPKGLDGPGNAFISLAPQHTTIERGWSLYWKDGLADVTWEAFRQKLRSLDSVVCSLELHQSMFQPIWWPSRMRRVSIKAAPGGGAKAPAPVAEALPVEAEEGAQTDAAAETPSEAAPEVTAEADENQPSHPEQDDVFVLNIQYSGFTQAWKDIAIGDYLVHVGDKNAKTVFEITDRNEHTFTCLRVEATPNGEGNAKWQPSKDDESYAIKAFDPVDYMAGMYAIYMFHALFYGSDTRSVTDFGNRVSAESIDFPLGSDLKQPSDYMAQGPLAFWKKDRAPFDELAMHSCVLCVWLMLGGYRSAETETACWSLITGEIQAWMTNVLTHLGVDSPRIRALRYPSKVEIDAEVLEAINSDVVWAMFGADDWDRTVKDYLT